MAHLKRRQIFSEINITPLTDVFLVLLIIMMVVAPLLDSTGLKLAVPSVAPSEDITDDPKIIQLKVNEQGQYYVTKGSGDNAAEEQVGRAVLTPTLRNLKETLPEGVVITVNPNATHEALTFAMDATQSAGVTKVAVTSSDAENNQSAEEQ